MNDIHEVEEALKRIMLQFENREEDNPVLGMWLSEYGSFQFACDFFRFACLELSTNNEAIEIGENIYLKIYYRQDGHSNTYLDIKCHRVVPGFNDITVLQIQAFLDDTAPNDRKWKNDTTAQVLSLDWLLFIYAKLVILLTSKLEKLNKREAMKTPPPC